MALVILLLLFVGSLVGCGREVTPTTTKATLTPPPQTIAPVSAAPTATVDAQVQAVGITELDAHLARCVTALVVVSAYHRHSASVETVVGSFFEGGDLRGTGSAIVQAPEFIAATGEGLLRYIYKPDLQPVDLLNRYCKEVIDLDLVTQLFEEIQKRPD